MKVHFIIFLVIELLVSTNSKAQLMNANWIFGDSAGIHFNIGLAEAIASNIGAMEGCASISDNEGNLLFYSNGLQVWDKNHNVMPNGTGLLAEPDFGGDVGSSTTQSSLILPMDTTEGLYYLFCLSAFGNAGFGPGLTYSIIDMTLNGGLGDISASKNIVIWNSLDNGLTEKLVALKHGNGKDYWLIVHEMGNNKFIRFKIDSTGVSTPSFQEIGTIHEDYYGQMFVSYDASKLAVVSHELVEVFTIDRCTGNLSNGVNITPDDALEIIYGCAISSDNRMVYISEQDALGYEQKILQYNLTNPSDWEIIYNGEFDVWPVNVGQFQMGLDNKIYFPIGLASYPNDFDEFYSFNTTVHRINYPDLPGADCGLELNAIALSDGARTTNGLPNLVNYHLTELIPLCPDTIVDTTVNIINNINNEIIIIQNFASETINIKNLPVGENEINILDITGKSVFVGFTNWSDYTFRLNLGKGCYVINILDVGGNFLFSKSIII